MLNYRPVSHVPFLGKLFNHMVALHLQGFMEEMDTLGPYYYNFRPGLETEIALFTLVDDQESYGQGGSASLLVSWISQWVLIILIIEFLLGFFSVLSYNSVAPSWKVGFKS